MMEKYPGLKNLFSVCLNQDFDLIFGAADYAIRAYVDRHERDQVAGTINETREIFNMRMKESEIRKLILEDFGSCYYYPAEWSSAEMWLKHVLELLVLK